MTIIYDKVGCSINGEFTEKEMKKFRDAGWITAEEYMKLHPEEFE